MMKKKVIQQYKYPRRSSWRELLQRAPVVNNTEQVVKSILQKVKKQGDKALFSYAKEFDKSDLQSLTVAKEEIIAAEKLVSKEVKSAIRLAKKNITAFHALQATEPVKIETMPGVLCWRRALPIEKVGLYIPGGSAPLFSTVLMLAVPAQLAGCPEIVLCTPAGKDGKINPAILVAAKYCGITQIFKTGGAQAIAAMAYGTETIPKVFKIFGPGNNYVTMAKQLVQRDGVAIDMPAGPSEILVIADETANPEFVAADLLSQAEHGPDSQAILLTTSETLATKVNLLLDDQLNDLPRKEIAARALQNSKLVILHTLDEAIDLSNLYAPEHLLLACRNAPKIVKKIRSAGSVFIGNYSPESAGDYASGTNHTLPTNGYAAAYSGVSLDSFVKNISYQQLNKKGLRNIAKTVMQMAMAEGLEAHSRAVSIRLKQKK